MKINKNRSTVFIFIGAVGYLICLIADIILSVLPNGLLLGEALSEYEKAVYVMSGTASSRFVLSAGAGTLSMVLIALGMYGIYLFLSGSNPKASYLVLISGIGAAVMGAVYHIICTTAAWIFIEGKMTREAFDLYQKYISDHTLLMSLNAVFYTVMALTLFILTVTGKTKMPRWFCVFNVVLIYFILSALGVPGSTSIGGLVMCIAFGVYSLKHDRDAE